MPKNRIVKAQNISSYEWLHFVSQNYDFLWQTMLFNPKINILQYILARFLDSKYFIFWDFLFFKIFLDRRNILWSTFCKDDFIICVILIYDRINKCKTFSLLIWLQLWQNYAKTDSVLFVALYIILYLKVLVVCWRKFICNFDLFLIFWI